MADTETLTDEEREAWAMMSHGPKALRIIDDQAGRIARAQQILSEPLHADSPESRLAADVRRALGG
jgi:hypothetical protein